MSRASRSGSRGQAGRPRLRRIAALVVLLTTLAAIGLAGRWREQAAAMTRSATSRKLAAADRVICTNT